MERADPVEGDDGDGVGGLWSAFGRYGPILSMDGNRATVAETAPHEEWARPQPKGEIG
jgi:hypothetical protein